MEINITSLLEEDLFQFSHSAYEGGENAGRNTWNAAKEAAATAPILRSEEELEAMRGWAKSSGGWTREEIDAWDAEELNALFLQLVSGDVRSAGWDSLEEAEWDDEGVLIDSRTGERSENCTVCRGDDGNLYFSLYE